MVFFIQVETVLDKYMVVSGAPKALAAHAHAEEIVLLSVKMQHSLRGITLINKGSTLRVRLHRYRRMLKPD